MSAAVLTTVLPAEPGLRPAEGSPLLSKVDDRGNTHIYQRKTAGELLVGEHLLEHVIGHQPMVATPILAIEPVEDGVIVTIPDRHSDNAPVQELYAADKPVFISKTPQGATRVRRAGQWSAQRRS